MPRSVQAVVLAGVIAILSAGAFMIRRAEGRTNKVALAASPQPVGVVRAVATTYRAARTYGGTLESWVTADVGPQRTAAYVDTVLVRPGARVAKGDVLGALDCGTASSTSRAVAMRARAVDTRQQALANESARLEKLRGGKFVSENELERAIAKSAEELARLESEKGNLARVAVAVDDCVLRAPFDGEVAGRFMDPGWFARPGSAVLSIVDRSTLRFGADAPETDYDIVAPGTPVRVHVYATGADVEGTIARRTPTSDADTRTVHFEVDIPAPERAIPSNTTAEVHIDVGSAIPATEIPLYAAAVRDTSAALLVVEDGVVRARTARVLGELGGALYLEPTLHAGTAVIAAGRALLADGDRVLAVQVAEAK